MKLIKKLLPVATLATTAMVVTPFVSSCSKSIDASDLAWKPSSQHDAATIKLNPSDWTQYKELSKDYYESNSSIHFKEDMCYTEIEQINNKLETIKKGAGVTNANVTFNVNISDVQLTSMEGEVESVKYPGYKTSFRISVDTIFSYKQVTTDGTDRWESDYKEISSTVETVTDFFTYLVPSTGNAFRYLVLSNDNNNWKDTIDVNAQLIIVSKITAADGSVKNISNTTSTSYTEEYTKSKIGSKSIISDKSYYLAKVTYN